MGAVGGAGDTCWTLIRAAGAGERAARDRFVSRYAPVVRAYFGDRWRDSPLRQEIDDAVQEVFLDCLREGGVLARADPTRPGGFRAFLFGVARTAALRAERASGRRRDRPADEPLDPDRFPADDASPSRAFDHAYARTVMEEAGERLRVRAEAAGDEARRRVSLIRLRFTDGLPIRAIAERSGEDPARLHHEFAKARAEFKEALLEVVAVHHPGDPGEVAREAARLVSLLG